MPELPEVETLKNSLEEKLIGLTVKNLNLRRENLRYKISETLGNNIVGFNIIAVRRRAKYLIIDLSNDFSLIVHLGMSGRFTLQSQNYEIKKHDHVIIDLDNNDKLVFNDARRFGMIYSFQTKSLEEKLFHKLAIEPFSSLFNVNYLKSKITSRKIPIKNLLMNNQIIVGVGNIYASESLYLAKIHPSKLGIALTDNEITRLIRSIQEVLLKAIIAGGTTLKDFVNGNNTPGYFKQQLLVYNKDGQQCQNCNNNIAKTKQSGRSTFYCSVCQT